MVGWLDGHDDGDCNDGDGGDYGDDDDDDDDDNDDAGHDDLIVSYGQYSESGDERLC